MNKTNTIKRLEKHKNELEKQIRVIDEIISSIQHGIDTDSMPREKTKNDTFGENEFYQIVSNNEYDMSTYRINPVIIENQQNMYDFWCELKEDNKTDFTIPELNLIRWLISDLFDKYDKKKKNDLVSSINTIVRNRSMRKSYEKIIV